MATELPLRELHFDYARSSGPGGQNVNKVSSKVVMRWSLDQTQAYPPGMLARLRALLGKRVTVGGELVVTSDRFRDRGRNIADCLEKLRVWIEIASRPPVPRRATKPSRGSNERRLRSKQHRGATKRLRRESSDD